ncbi:MAG: HlyD family secretion protein [Geminicoccaceae bacterium]
MSVASGLGRRLPRVFLTVAGPLAIALTGLYFYMSSGRYVTTENAYVKTELTVIASEVSGLVTEVAVSDNQSVEAGQVLFRLDPRRFAVERNRREAELGSARQRVKALKAKHRAKQAELVAATRDAEFLQEELDRSEKLKSSGNISETRLLAARRLVTQAENKIEVAREEISEVLAELGGDLQLPADEHPDVMKARAELRQAELDLEATTIKAPSDAIATNVHLQVGEYVSDGDPVLSLVSTKGFWIEANLKETDLTHLRVGQQAELKVDAYPESSWTAEVASLAPATGAEYALLPPQNASGNWVKVVQRVPVRLQIEADPDRPPLRAGMSVAVSIDTGYERPLPGILKTARAWILSDGL